MKPNLSFLVHPVISCLSKLLLLAFNEIRKKICFEEVNYIFSPLIRRPCFVNILNYHLRTILMRTVVLVTTENTIINIDNLKRKQRIEKSLYLIICVLLRESSFSSSNYAQRALIAFHNEYLLFFSFFICVAKIDTCYYAKRIWKPLKLFGRYCERKHNTCTYIYINKSLMDPCFYR